MLLNALQKIFGSKNEREINRLKPLVKAINDLEPAVANLSDSQLQAKTGEFRERLSRGETLDDLLAEAFAVVREAARRTLGQRHFDVQLVGGIVLHEGKIAEMKTGEGKTLAATLPVYLNALTGNGVHVVTVNDYLAKRDAVWMGAIYNFLRLSVGVIVHELDDAERQQAYRCDITYGTNNEFGFDYLRDNMKFRIEDMVQRELHYAIVDEVDSILIDEARTPLIISGPVEHIEQGYYEELKPLVIRLRQNQSRMVQTILAEALKLLEEDPESETAIEKLLLVKRGDPKNPQFLDLIAEKPALKSRIDRMESYLSGQKILSQHDGHLFCAIDERSNAVELSEKGLELLSKGRADAFVVPSLDDGYQAIDSNEQLPPAERMEARQALETKYRETSERIHTIHQLVKAYWLFQKDVNYVIKDGQVIIVDEFTGRMMPGRRWSDGLHQSIEAKEGVKVAEENQTLATITFQNYFRMYKKLAGMTGTADTEAAEFKKIYNLDVMVIPTNMPMIRQDFPDSIYRTQREKYKAVVEEVKECHRRGQPVLVGTISIENSEKLSQMFKQEKLPHQVLNAKYHEMEAKIIAQAGRFGSLTISTNMAGRGTDIMLGGNPEMLAREEAMRRKVDPSADPEGFRKILEEMRSITSKEYKKVIEADGLHVLGTERHESRRIDNQLRGRSGRQGDPGTSRFYLSLEDDLLRIFGSQRISGVMSRLGMEEGQPIEHSLISRAIENAQKRVEAHNFDIRKHLLEYDNVMNKQREVIYAQRKKVLAQEGVIEEIPEIIAELAEGVVDPIADEKTYPEEWDYRRLNESLIRLFSFGLDIRPEAIRDMTREKLMDKVTDLTMEIYRRREAEFGAESMRLLEKALYLQSIDTLWKEHLLSMDHLKEGIGLRGYGQRNPLQEYQKEGYGMFTDLMQRIKEETIQKLFRVQIARPQEVARFEEVRQQPLVLTHGEEVEEKHKPTKRESKKVGRNEPCPCGSGKKYKKCHGR
ncbi:MAG: preprotein translocase subunit SecA [Thermodesulfobacteriota bacterium]|nr:preprotein translocase subunit SecA [Thermodesulfobacteriota bacterium]